MAEFEPIFEREVINYELPVVLEGETVSYTINIDNCLVVLHDDDDEKMKCFDHLLIADEDNGQVMRLWRQPQNGALFERLIEDHDFDVVYRKVPTYDDQEAYMGFIARRITIDEFFD